ncbi:MAG TPA: hypothetical protein VFK44_03725, partial [Bacillales bacterium]|nr:hypothetical protein [Bacillales bacterium]
MESHMHEAFSDEILAALAGRYRVKIEDLQSLGGFENFVYTFGDGDHSRVLRISHGGHRSADQLQAEVDWVVDLFKNDIPVSQPLPSLNDRLVESLRTTAGEFHAVCFAKAAGGPAKPEDWNDQLFHTLGKIMG